MNDMKLRPATGRRSTIYDIAAETKASASTVSLVLNGSWSRYRIKEDTARRILKSAQDSATTSTSRPAACGSPGRASPA